MSRTIVVLDAANDARLARDLTAGGAFVVGYDLAISDECDLVVHNGELELRLVARVVYVDPVDPSRGAGLELVGFGAAVRDRLAALVDGSGERRLPALDTAAGSSPGIETGTTRAAISPSSIEAARRRSGRASVMRPEPVDFDPPTVARVRPMVPVDLGALIDESVDAPEPPAQLGLGSERQVPAEADDDDNDDDHDDSPAARTLQARIRGLNLAQQVKLAHAGDINERIILERLYGKNVWEPLLRNPRLTGPEVARIAKMGALPRTLVEIIVGNGGWLALPDVRRALLTNPRLGADQIHKVLRLMPKPELRLVPTQIALPMAVREAAKRLLRGEAG